jgi:hypothetical protein
MRRMRAKQRRSPTRCRSGHRAHLLFGVASSLWSLPSSAFADVEVFDVPPECGEYSAFRDRVLALGADGAALEAADVRLVVEPTWHGFRLVVRVAHEDDSIERVLSDRDCVDLVDASAVIVVLALRELLPGGATAAATTGIAESTGDGLVLTIVPGSSVEPSDSGPSAAAEPASEPDPQPLAPVRLELEIGVGFGVGVLHRPAAAASVALRLAIEWFEAEVGASLWPSRFAEGPRGPPEGARLWIYGGSLSTGAAWHVGIVTLAPAVELDLGAISAQGVGLERADTVVDLHAALGARFAVRVGLFPAFGLYAEAGGGAMLHRPSFEIDGIGTVFATPPALLRCGAGVLVRP